MSTGVYGIVKPSDVSPSDVQISVFYSPNRESGITNSFILDSSNLTNVSDNLDGGLGIDVFSGLYNLKLPVGQFENKGFYTIVLKPVEIKATLVDCGVLSALPNTKGIVFDASDSNLSQFTDKFENNALTGYRVEYLDKNDPTKKVRNLFRVITSNNRVEPVTQNLADSNAKAVRYRFNDNATLVFCTVTPNASTSTKPDVFPYIGEPNQQVILTHTLFNTVTIEVEIVDHDFETLAYGLFGNQSKSLEDGIYTIYNFNNEIYEQYNLYELKSQFTGVPLYEIKEKRSSIDTTKNFNDITEI
jgi:hypothetical protein